MWLMIAFALFAISVLISLGEVYYERDWPRETFRYVVIFGAILLFSFAQ